MPTVVVLDSIAQEGLDLLQGCDGIDVQVKTGLKGDDLRQVLSKCDGAICRSGVTISSDVLKGNRRLRAIVRAGVGTDNIDHAMATRQGIVVMNTPAGNTISTAEHTFAMMMALSRNIAPAYQSLIKARWDRKEYMGTQLSGKTLGIVGLGRIGQEVARRAIAFEMRVAAFDPFLSMEQATKLGVELVPEVSDMFPYVDYLTVHTPLTSETKNLIDAAAIERLKPGVRLINCARGGIYNESALLAGLQSGKIGGVALDVFEQEPCLESPLFEVPGVVCTPHLGASTEEAQTQVAVEAAQLLVNYLTTGEIRHAINMAAMDPKTLEELQGYLDVAYRLGLLLSQWNDGGTSACQVQYRGEVVDKNTKLLTAAFCAGLLERALDEDVNVVNAEILLRERGVKLNEVSDRELGDFSSSITATVDCHGRTFTAAGTLFGSKMPRLIRLGGYRLEAYMDGNLLLFAHDDVPGVIGNVGAIFGDHRINIAQMSVGREGENPGGAAIGVLNLDSIPPVAALDAILQQDGIHRVKVIEMPAAGNLPGWLI